MHHIAETHHWATEPARSHALQWANPLSHCTRLTFGTSLRPSVFSRLVTAGISGHVPNTSMMHRVARAVLFSIVCVSRYNVCSKHRMITGQFALLYMWTQLGLGSSKKSLSYGMNVVARFNDALIVVRSKRIDPRNCHAPPGTGQPNESSNAASQQCELKAL